MLCKSCLFRLFAKIAELLTELGAEHSEDVLYYDVSIGNWGIRFVKNIFHGRLFYSNMPVYKHPINSVSVLTDTLSVSTDCDDDKFPDMLAYMIERVIQKSTRSVQHVDRRTFNLFSKAVDDHNKRPTRDSLLTKRLLINYVKERMSALSAQRRGINIGKRPAINGLLEIKNNLPTSLRQLKGARIRKVASDYYHAELGDNLESGASRITAAMHLKSRMLAECVH